MALYQIKKLRLFHLMGLPVCLASTATADTSLEAERVCKPVLAQINVEFSKSGFVEDGTSLLIQYDERGSDPFGKSTFSRRVRTSFCDFLNGRCAGSRARYERRLESSRRQSIQLRMMNGNGNPIVGGVQWMGPSYPDRIWIECDLANPNPEIACKIKSLEYTPEVKPTSNMRRHDKCRPTSRAMEMA
ncbi:MAG: hypothetical protein ABJ242_03875 [Marinomonas sp.]